RWRVGVPHELQGPARGCATARGQQQPGVPGDQRQEQRGGLGGELSTAEKATPRHGSRAHRGGASEKIPAATYSPTRKPCSTIGSGGLNCRVRDGNGWNPSDKATGKLGRLRRVPASSVERLAIAKATGNLCICASDVQSRRHCAALDPGPLQLRQ